MDSHSVTAVTPFRLLDLPLEVRDDIYEAAIFDLRPPDMFLRPQDPDSVRLRKMNIEVLLANRQVYWEARDVIVRRGQLIMISMERGIYGGFEEVLVTLAGITAIDPMYRRLCILSHHIDARPPPSGLTFVEPEGDWECILHRQDAQFFLRVMMGEFNFRHGRRFGSRAMHTLNLHCSSTYGQHEFSSVYATQTLVLQQYRNILREMSRFTIRGPSIGWESGLYGVVLQDIRSIDDRQPTELIDDLRSLEQEGSQILLQTGDIEAANVPWVKALGICDVVGTSFQVSFRPHVMEEDHFPTAFKTHVERWIQLRRQHGNECTVPFIELWYKLISNRLSGALRLIEQGHRLAPRDGRALRPKGHYLRFVRDCCGDLRAIKYSFEDSPVSPPPSVHAHLYFTMASIFRLLDATKRALLAYSYICRATELAPDDGAIQQEKERVEIWIRRLVDDGTLESLPES